MCENGVTNVSKKNLHFRGNCEIIVTYFGFGEILYTFLSTVSMVHRCVQHNILYSKQKVANNDSGRSQGSPLSLFLLLPLITMLQFDILGAPCCRVSFFRMLENNKLSIVRTPSGDPNVNEATKKTNELRIYKGVVVMRWEL
jgi:hypothetical protein